MKRSNQMKWGMSDCDMQRSCRKVDRCPYLNSLCYVAQENGIVYSSITVTREDYDVPECTFVLRTAQEIPPEFWDEVVSDIGLGHIPDVRSEPSQREGFV